MNNHLYHITYTCFGTINHYFFRGPDIGKEGFQNLCDELLPKAGYNAFLRISVPEMDEWIKWTDVVESLIPLLKEQGYQCVSLDSVDINPVIESIIGLLDDQSDLYYNLSFAGPLIAGHNLKLEQKKYEESLLRNNKYVAKKKNIQIIK